ncbi:NUDIX domain-containing protein [Candidatus Woesearchaeota archaeon]|nr:NUDIX domain-containing protein [Candidatus Woesearchaeota archaeon]
MSAKEISLNHAHQNKLFYFVANVVVYRDSDKKCLLLKRGDNEKVHPGKYCVPGGKLEWSDLPLEQPTRRNGDVLDYENAIEKLLLREVGEEAGLIIHDHLHYINSVAFIRPDGIPVVLAKFAARYKDGKVVLEKGSFTDHAWVDASEIEGYDCIAGIAQEVRETIDLFRKV